MVLIHWVISVSPLFYRDLKLLCAEQVSILVMHRAERKHLIMNSMTHLIGY